MISFKKLYNTDFFISEPMAKAQYWAQRGNVYNALGRPKISHTLLWFKNCCATITNSFGNIVEAKENQLAYMAKGIEYVVNFNNTNNDKEDTIVIHFQMTDNNGNDIIPVSVPIICINDVQPSFAMAINTLADEFKKNIVCIPYVKAEIFKIISAICQKQKNRQQKTDMPVYELVLNFWKRTAI